MLKNVNEIIKELSEAYKKDPSGWYIFRTEDKGKYDSFFLKDDTLYQIKGIPKTPFEFIGMGGKSKIDEISINSGIPQGFNILSQQEDFIILLGGVLDFVKKPDLNIISSKQEELNRKLD